MTTVDEHVHTRNERVDVFGFPSDTSMLLAILACLVWTGNLLLGTVLSAVVSNRTDTALAVLSRGANLVTGLPIIGLAMYYLWTRWRFLGMKPVRNRWVLGSATDLGARLGLTAPPELLVAPNLGDRAMVGDRGLVGKRPCIALGPQLLTLATGSDANDRSLFNAVLLHELGHVRNRDAHRYQIAVMLRSLYFLGAGAAVVILFMAGKVSAGCWTLLRVACVGLAIELTLRALMRAREHYADLRAAAVDGEVLGVVLRRNIAVEPGPGWMGHLLNRHPRPAVRADLLDDPVRLLRFPVGHAAIAGLLAGICLTSVQMVLAQTRGGPPMVDAAAMVAVAVVVGLPLGIFLALGLWRHTWGVAMVGAPCRPPAHGLAVAAGIVVGSYLGPYRLVGEGNLRIPPNWRVVLLLGIGCVLLCQWLVACAGTWYALRPSTSLPSPLRWIGLPVAAVVAGGLVALFVRGTLSDRSLALAASAAVVLVLLGFLRSAALTGIVSVPAFPAMVTCLFVFGGIPFTTPPGPPYCAPSAPPVTMVVVMCDALRPNCRPGSFTELDRARVRAAVEDLVGAHVIVVAPSSGISSLAIGNGPLATTVERGLYEDLRQRVNQIPGVADVSMVDAASAAIPRRESC